MNLASTNDAAAVECGGEWTPSAVRVSGVWASYGKHPVLTGVDLRVEPGSMVAVAGPNGVGKSTLLRLIAGARRPDEGTVEVGGVEVGRLRSRERARLVSMVPQDPELPPGAAAVEVVLMGRNPHLGLLSWEGEEDLAIAIDALAMTETLSLADRPVDRMSGGEKQRVAIAMALAQRTPVMVLDEPTANLDLAYQPRMMSLLRRLARMGKTIVVAVHDLTLAAEFCDQVAMMADGILLTIGSPSDALTPENIRRAYGADVRIIEHPDTGNPIVVNAWKDD